jgi:hypothetical protein
MRHSERHAPDSQSIAEVRPVSRPRFARRVRGRRALTLAFAPRLIIQLSGECRISSSTKRAPIRNRNTDDARRFMTDLSSLSMVTLNMWINQSLESY